MKLLGKRLRNLSPICKNFTDFELINEIFIQVNFNNQSLNYSEKYLPFNIRKIAEDFSVSEAIIRIRLIEYNTRYKTYDELLDSNNNLGDFFCHHLNHNSQGYSYAESATTLSEKNKKCQSKSSYIEMSKLHQVHSKLERNQKDKLINFYLSLGAFSISLIALWFSVTEQKGTKSAENTTPLQRGKPQSTTH